MQILKTKFRRFVYVSLPPKKLSLIILRLHKLIFFQLPARFEPN